MRITEDYTATLSSGYSELEIDGDHITLNLIADSQSEVYVRILKGKDITIHSEVKENAGVTYLFWNVAEDKIQITEDHNVKRGGTLTIAYGEVNQADTERNIQVHLLEEGSHALVSSASLVKDHKTFGILVESQAPHTEGIMENYAVVLKGGKYLMDATGSIVKGAHGSESHQTSRALCFDEGQTSKIKPQLLIDENDVKASHATTLGRVDEDQLYYMMTRGLNVKQCTELISTGYLLPVTKVIQDEKLQQILAEEMERKIAEL